LQQIIGRHYWLSQRPALLQKLSIVLEEIDEAAFWLEFIIDESLLKSKQVEPLLKEAQELTARGKN
jgi:four helix bundle protein